jgi:hypothetical protein
LYISTVKGQELYRVHDPENESAKQLLPVGSHEAKCVEKGLLCAYVRGKPSRCHESLNADYISFGQHHGRHQVSSSYYRRVAGFSLKVETDGVNVKATAFTDGEDNSELTMEVVPMSAQVYNIF